MASGKAFTFSRELFCLAVVVVFNNRVPLYSRHCIVGMTSFLYTCVSKLNRDISGINRIENVPA